MHLEVHSRPNNRHLEVQYKKNKCRPGLKGQIFRGVSTALRRYQAQVSPDGIPRPKGVPGVQGMDTVLWTPVRPAWSNQRGPQGKKSIREVTRRRTYRSIDIWKQRRQTTARRSSRKKGKPRRRTYRRNEEASKTFFFGKTWRSS